MRTADNESEFRVEFNLHEYLIIYLSHWGFSFRSRLDSVSFSFSFSASALVFLSFHLDLCN